MHRILLLVIVLFVLPAHDGALAQKAVPPLTGRVMDLADILTPATESSLDAQLGRHEAATGNQVVLLTVGALEGEVLEDYSLRVARAWELGTAANDNGVLFLVAVQDRKMRIEVGRGLEGDLPDVVASRIIRNEIRPQFRRGDYDGGVRAGVGAIIGSIEGTYTPPDHGEQAPPFWFGLVFMIIPSIFAFIGVILSGFFRWFLFVFLIPFFGVSGFALFGSIYGAGIWVFVYATVFVAATRHAKVKAFSEKMKAAGSARIGPFTFSAGAGGSFGGGGFSGGGGSFGGGGASGGW